MLVLSRDVVGSLRDFARAADPAECCGLLIGRDHGDDSIVHRIEPIANDASDAYHVPAARFAAAERTARTVGDHVCGIYHSHPHGAARPSSRDIDLAWPGFVYVIVGRGGATRAWRLADDRRRFSETLIDVRAS